MDAYIPACPLVGPTENMEEEEEGEERRRPVCAGCARPLRVCLCHVIPAPRIPTSTRVVIIQHPHEARHPLSTTPLLTTSLLNATAVVSRRLTPALLPLDDDRSPTYYYLFPPSPSAPSAPLSLVKERIRSGGPAVLVAFDATWKHAREMVAASEGYLGKFATRVCLDGFDPRAEGGSIYDSELILRKEPCGGCVSTAEAVARWLGAVEDNGPEIEARLVGALREMARLQAQFLKPVKPRPKLLKQSNNNSGRD